MALTIVLAGAAQWQLSRPGTLSLGGLLYGAAVVSLLATLALQRKSPLARLEISGATRMPPLLVPCVVLAQVVAAALIYTRSEYLIVATGLWVLSMLLAVGVAARASWPDASRGSLIIHLRSALALPRIDLLAFGAILLCGAALRLISLEAYPSGIHGDEAESALVAASVLNGSGPNPFGTAFLGEPALFAWLQAPFVLVLGHTITAVRLVSALAGTLTLIPFYALTRAMFGPMVAALASVFLVGSAVAIHYSRLAVSVPEALLLATLSYYCVWRAYTSRSPLWWLLSGLAAGAAFYFNFQGPPVQLVIALFMLYLLASRRSTLGAWTRDVALLCAGAILAMMPLAAFLATPSNQFVGHMASRLIFQDWSRLAAEYRTSDTLPILWGQLTANLAAFTNGHGGGDFYPFDAPMLNGITAALWVLGLALTFVRLRDARYALLFFWFWTFLIVAGVLTIDSPQTHRLLPALPPALIVAAVALDWMAGVGAALLGPSRAFVVTALALLVPIAATAYDASTYFGADAQAYPWADTTAQARYIAELPPGYQVLVAGVPYIYASHGTTRYLAEKVDPKDLSNPPAQLPLPLDRPLAIVVNPGLDAWLATLQSVYPSGQATPVTLPDGRRLFTSFVVPAGSAGAWPHPQGLAARIQARDAGAPVWAHDSPVVAFRDINALVPGGQPPFTGQWRGRLSVPQSGPYSLELWTDGAASLRVDGQAVIDSPPADQVRSVSKTVDLTAGQHDVQIDAQFPRSPGMLELYWQPQGASRELVPAWALSS